MVCSIRAFFDCNWLCSVHDHVRYLLCHLLIVPYEARLLYMMITIHHNETMWIIVCRLWKCICTWIIKMLMFPIENWYRIRGARIWLTKRCAKKLLGLKVELVQITTCTNRTMKMMHSSYPAKEPHTAQSTNDTKHDVHDRTQNTINYDQTTRWCVS